AGRAGPPPAPPARRARGTWSGGGPPPPRGSPASPSGGGWPTICARQTWRSWWRARWGWTGWRRRWRRCCAGPSVGGCWCARPAKRRGPATGGRAIRYAQGVSTRVAAQGPPTRAAALTPEALGQRLDRVPPTWFHRRLLFLSGMGWMFDAMDILLLGSVLAAISRQWGLSPGTTALISSANLLGMFFGAAASGWLADR